MWFWAIQEKRLIKKRNSNFYEFNYAETWVRISLYTSNFGRFISLHSNILIFSDPCEIANCNLEYSEQKNAFSIHSQKLLFIPSVLEWDFIKFLSMESASSRRNFADGSFTPFLLFCQLKPAKATSLGNEIILYSLFHRERCPPQECSQNMLT